MKWIPVSPKIQEAWWILPEWGNRDPGPVRGIEIERWLPRLEKAPGQKLAPATLAKIRYVMHNLYQHAIRYGG